MNQQTTVAQYMPLRWSALVETVKRMVYFKSKIDRESSVLLSITTVKVHYHETTKKGWRNI